MFKVVALVVVGLLWSAWLFAKLRECEGEPLKIVLDRFSRLGWFNKIAVLFIVVQLTMFGGAKHGTNDVDQTGGPTNAPPMMAGMPSPTSGREPDSPLSPTNESRIAEADYDNGYVLCRVGTNETHDFTAPEGALVATNWMRRGAADDCQRLDLGGMTFPFRDLLVTNLIAFADGTVRFSPGAAFPSFAESLGIVPEANWSQLDASRRPSVFWSRRIGHDRFVMTWQNALLGRELANGVSYQVELNRNGGIICRYERPGTNVTSASYHRLMDADRTNPDADGDGLTTEEEIFDTGTDPHLADTDGDGVPDGEEARLRTSAFSRDTDGDAYADATDPHPTTADAREDADGDGLPDDWKNGWFGEGAAVSLTDDPGQDGINNLNALLMGVNPLASGTNGFVETASAKPVNLNAWALVPSAFSFVAPVGTSNLVARTFAVGRTSPWQHLLVSSCPNRPEGWESADIAIVWHAGDLSGVVPASAADSWRIPLGADFVSETMTFEVVATGPQPSLSRPLYLLRWTPHLEFRPSGDVSVFRQDRLRVAVRPNPVTGAYELPFAMSDDYPHRGGLDAEVVQSLGMPPVAGLKTEGRTFSVFSPEAFDLPPEGTQPPSRLIFYRMIIDNSCEVSSGPRASQYATPYPLDTRAARRSYQAMTTVPADETISVTLLPDIPELGYTNLTPQVRAPRRLLGAAPGPGLTPPADVGPTVEGDPCTNDTTRVESGPDGHDPEPDPENPDPGCRCNRDGTSLGSFRIRISLGEPGKDERSGYLWTVVTGRTAVAASIFSILGTEGVSAVTNDVGDVTIVCSDNGGRTIVVSNVVDGVDIPVRLASGELDGIWRIRNPGGDLSTIRAVRLTHLFNATSDETYAIRHDDDGNVLWEQTDNIRGVRRVLRETADPANPEFVREEFERTYLAGRLIREETRTYECIGAGVFGVRRLASAEGFDERGWHSESRTYWCDARNRHRHGKLRSVRSDRQAWAYHDYDSAGRETVRIEQLDGSPFPELAEISLDASLGDDVSAKVTLQGYETSSAGDAADRNDSELPRLTETYVRRNGDEPVLISRTERICTRECDSRGIPVRRIVTTEGFGAAVRTSTRLEYPQDAAVPAVLRGMEIYSEEPDGTAVETEYATSNSFIIATARTSFNGNYRKTYAVTVTDAAFGNVVREETRLTANDAVIEWTDHTYDDRRRLRSSAYSDGTSETNAYSCCRLLWKRDREGRKTLRSARTGTDSLYYAEEDVWRAGVAEDGRFRIVQHFFDGLGRETNTVTYAGSNEGEAVDPVAPTGGQEPVARTTEYADEWNCRASVATDERGAVTDRWEYSLENLVESHSQTTADEKMFGEDRTTYRGGRTETYRWWDNKWTRQTASTGYGADGSRVDAIVTDSSDCGVVTNSVITYDPLGRVMSSVTPLGTSVFAYDGATTRVLAETVTAGGVVRVRSCLYDDCGEEVGSVADGVTERSDVTYEETSNAWWRVTTESTACEGGTNAMTVTREQLTGLGDGLRSRTITDIIGGVKSCKTVAFDYGSGVATETLTSSAASPVVSRSVYGIETSRTAEGEEVASFFDAWGRCVGRARSPLDASTQVPIEYCLYDAVGDLIEKGVFTNGTEAVAEFYEYDQLGNRTAVVNANGEEVLSAYDAQGNLVSEGGATYPVRYDYDTANRRIAMRTTRDGEMWDETRWTYDPVTGLCTSKRRADGTTVSYTYTPDGLPEQTTRSNGHWVRNVYDAARQVVGVERNDDEDVAFVRDPFGRETSAANAVATYAYALDISGVATNEMVTIGGEGVAIRRGLDDNGRIVDFGIDTNGQTGFVNLAYRSDGRLGAVSNGEVSVAYAYSDDGFDTGYSLSVAGGATFTRTVTRNPFRRELVTRVENGIGADFAYGFDALGRPVSRNGDSFTYDARGQVTATSLIPHPSSLIPVAAGYTYDEIGNLLRSSVNAETNRYVSNFLNQYTEINQAIEQSEQSNNPVYDAEGNLTQYGEWSYTYDAQNRLATVSSNGLLIASNFYDHMGRRVRMVTSEASYTFIYDGWNLVLELSERGGETERTEYCWGKDISGTLQGAGGIGGLLYLKRNGTIFVPIYDAYGNVMEYRAADGSLVASYVYDAFGRTIAQTGSLVDTFRHRHATKFYEPETGFYYYGHRHYVPSLARWLTTDPIEEDGGLNLYAFCGNNGVYRFDATGKSWSECYFDCVEKYMREWSALIVSLWPFKSKQKVDEEHGRGFDSRKRRSTWTNEQSRRIQKVRIPLTKLPKNDPARGLLPKLEELRNTGAKYTKTFWWLVFAQAYYEVAVRGFCSEYCGETECGLHMELPF